MPKPLQTKCNQMIKQNRHLRPQTQPINQEWLRENVSSFSNTDLTELEPESFAIWNALSISS